MHWIIEVINHGPSTAKDVVVNDVLPSGVKFISYSASKGYYAQSTGRWEIGELNNGEKVTLKIICKVLIEGVIINNANVTLSTNDTNLSNNHDNASITVIKKPDDPIPEPVIPTHKNSTHEKSNHDKPQVELTMRSTGNPVVYLLISIFAIFVCFWSRKREEYIKI